MLFSRFKSSTTTALIFTLFTSVLLITFVVVLNIYYFYTWNFDEKQELIEKTEQTALRIIKPQTGSGASIAEETNRFLGRIIEQ